MTRAGEVSAADRKAIEDAKKDEWLSAWDLWPFGYYHREYRAKKLAKFGLIQHRVFGVMDQYYVSANVQKEQ